MTNSSKDVNQRVATTSNKKPLDNKAARLGILYDILMLIILVIDLSIMFIDKLLTSDFFKSVGNWLTHNFDLNVLASFISHYNNDGFSIINFRNIEVVINHANASLLAGLFTLFFVGDLLLRWSLAVWQKTHYRWFFFPFIHWYEVIGCLPQFRLLRLLRVVIIIRRFYQMGYHILPKSWITSLKFYYDVVLEEVSDRVILKVVQDIRLQLKNSDTNQVLVKKIIDSNRGNIEQVILTMLRNELAPKLREELMPAHKDSPVAKRVGLAVADAVTKTPEIDMVLSKIPIAGSMIQSQMMGISQKVGYNIADSVSSHLLQDDVLDDVFVSIAHGIAHINVNQPELEAVVNDIIEESLTAFEEQVKIQQWQQKVKPNTDT